MILTFPDDLLIGIDEIDDQHREFYRQLNELHAAMREHRLGDVTKTVEYLESYAANHFAAEERMMLDAGYPGFPEHVTQHAAFAREVKRRRQQLAESGPTAPFVVELSSWITSWLRTHIWQVDGELARFLRERAASR